MSECYLAHIIQNEYIALVEWFKFREIVLLFMCGNNKMNDALINKTRNICVDDAQLTFSILKKPEVVLVRDLRRRIVAHGVGAFLSLFASSTLASLTYLTLELSDVLDIAIDWTVLLKGLSSLKSLVLIFTGNTLTKWKHFNNAFCEVIMMVETSTTILQHDQTTTEGRKDHEQDLAINKKSPYLASLEILRVVLELIHPYIESECVPTNYDSAIESDDLNEVVKYYNRQKDAKEEEEKEERKEDDENPAAQDDGDDDDSQYSDTESWFGNISFIHKNKEEYTLKADLKTLASLTHLVVEGIFLNPNLLPRSQLSRLTYILPACVSTIINTGHKFDENVVDETWQDFFDSSAAKLQVLEMPFSSNENSVNFPFDDEGTDELGQGDDEIIRDRNDQIVLSLDIDLNSLVSLTTLLLDGYTYEVAAGHGFNSPCLRHLVNLKNITLHNFCIDDDQRCFDVMMPPSLELLRVHNFEHSLSINNPPRFPASLTHLECRQLDNLLVTNLPPNLRRLRCETIDLPSDYGSFPVRFIHRDRTSDSRQNVESNFRASELVQQFFASLPRGLERLQSSTQLVIPSENDLHSAVEYMSAGFSLIDFVPVTLTRSLNIIFGSPRDVPKIFRSCSLDFNHHFDVRELPSSLEKLSLVHHRWSNLNPLECFNDSSATVSNGAFSCSHFSFYPEYTGDSTHGKYDISSLKSLVALMLRLKVEVEVENTEKEEEEEEKEDEFSDFDKRDPFSDDQVMLSMLPFIGTGTAKESSDKSLPKNTIDLKKIIGPSLRTLILHIKNVFPDIETFSCDGNHEIVEEEEEKEEEGDNTNELEEHQQQQEEEEESSNLQHLPSPDSTVQTSFTSLLGDLTLFYQLSVIKLFDIDIDPLIWTCLGENFTSLCLTNCHLLGFGSEALLQSNLLLGRVKRIGFSTRQSHRNEISFHDVDCDRKTFRMTNKLLSFANCISTINWTMNIEVLPLPLDYCPLLPGELFAEAHRFMNPYFVSEVVSVSPHKYRIIKTAFFARCSSNNGDECTFDDCV